MGGTLNRKRREPKQAKRLFECPACGKLLWRTTDTSRIRSYCSGSGKDVVLTPAFDAVVSRRKQAGVDK